MYSSFPKGGQQALGTIPGHVDEEHDGRYYTNMNDKERKISDKDCETSEASSNVCRTIPQRLDLKKQLPISVQG